MNNGYLARGMLTVERLGRGFVIDACASQSGLAGSAYRIELRH